MSDFAPGGPCRRRILPFLILDSRRALQGQCRSPSSYPQTAVLGDELGGVRRQSASEGQSHRLVLGGSDGRLAGRAPHHTWCQPPYSALAIRTALTLRAVFRLAL